MMFYDVLCFKSIFGFLLSERTSGVSPVIFWILLQFLEVEHLQIGISAPQAILAPTNRATVTMIASASKIMFVEKITATNSGIRRSPVLIAASKVTLLLGQQNEKKKNHEKVHDNVPQQILFILLTLIQNLRGQAGGRFRTSRRKHLRWRKTCLRRSP